MNRFLLCLLLLPLFAFGQTVTCFTHHTAASPNDVWPAGTQAWEVGANYNFFQVPDPSGVPYADLHYILGTGDQYGRLLPSETSKNPDGTWHDHRVWSGNDLVGVVYPWDFSQGSYTSIPVSLDMQEDYTQQIKCSGGRGGGCHNVVTMIDQTVCLTE